MHVSYVLYQLEPLQSWWHLGYSIHKSEYFDPDSVKIQTFSISWAVDILRNGNTNSSVMYVFVKLRTAYVAQRVLFVMV